MKSITESVRIEELISDRVPFWALGTTGRYNPIFGFIDLCNPATGHHQLFPAEAFVFSIVETTSVKCQEQKKEAIS